MVDGWFGGPIESQDGEYGDSGTYQSKKFDLKKNHPIMPCSSQVILPNKLTQALAK